MLWRRKAGTVGRLEPDHNDQVKKSEPYSVDLKLTLWSKRCVCVCARTRSRMPTQQHPPLCYSMDCSLPGSFVHGFPRKEYWSGLLGLPFPPPGDLPSPGIKPVSPASPALAGGPLPAEPLGMMQNVWSFISK